MRGNREEDKGRASVGDGEGMEEGGGEMGEGEGEEGGRIEESVMLFEGGEERRMEALCGVLDRAGAARLSPHTPLHAGKPSVAGGGGGGEGSCVVFCETRLQCKVPLPPCLLSVEGLRFGVWG